MSGERMSDVGNSPSDFRSSPPSIVDISPPDIARRRLTTGGAIQADDVRITRRETFECGFQARRHLLIAYERAERDDGETLIEGLPKSTLRGAVAISSASISIRAILALPLKRGGAAWPMM